MTPTALSKLGINGIALTISRTTENEVLQWRFVLLSTRSIAREKGLQLKNRSHKKICNLFTLMSFKTLFCKTQKGEVLGEYFGLSLQYNESEWELWHLSSKMNKNE